MPPKHRPILPPPPPEAGDKEYECVSSKLLHAIMKAMTEPFMKNQQSISTILECVECSIATVIDWVDTWGTRLPLADQGNQAKLANETREDDYNGEEEDEPFNPPHPPPRQQHRDDPQAHQELPHPLC
jgi:hypothetical protein